VAAREDIVIVLVSPSLELDFYAPPPSLLVHYVRLTRVQEPYRGRARFVQKLTFYVVPRPKLMFFMQNFKGFPMP